MENKSSDQWLYARHIIQTLNEHGTGYVFMPLGFLSRMGESIVDIRERIFKENLLDMVIEFPGGVFAQSHTSVALIVLQKNRGNEPVFMVNLAGKEGKKQIQVDIRRQKVRFTQFRELVKILTDRDEIAGLTCMVKTETIAKKGFCFSPEAYVEESIEVKVKNVRELIEEESELQKNLASVNKIYDQAMEQYLKISTRKALSR